MKQLGQIKKMRQIISGMKDGNIVFTGDCKKYFI